MSKLLIDRSVVEQALEALIAHVVCLHGRMPMTRESIATLRTALEQPEQEPARPSPQLAKPLGGVLPWGEAPTDESKIWFSFRGPDGFIWQDGQWVRLAQPDSWGVSLEPATPEQRKRFADSMRRVFGGVAQEQPDVPEAGFGKSQEPVAWVDIDEHGQIDGLRYFSDGNRQEVALCVAPTTRKPVEPVDGDVLPAVGSTVWIRHGRDDDAHACTVTGYYAWDDLGGNKNLHRVFVRLAYAGTDRDQARMLKDCFATKEAALAHGITGAGAA